jgi:hypothetical protein
MIDVQVVAKSKRNRMAWKKGLAGLAICMKTSASTLKYPVHA